MMTKILVVEDNVLLATNLERVLRSQGTLTVAAVAPTAEIALEELNHTNVELVLVDVSLPGVSGIDLVASIHERYPQLPCLMLSGHSEIDYVRRALAAGAKGYVVKNNPKAILEAIIQVLAGETYISEELRQKLYQ